MVIKKNLINFNSGTSHSESQFLEFKDGASWVRYSYLILIQN